jgi:hypothetical protein
MHRFGRRAFTGAAASLPTLLFPSFAQATLLRGLSLRDITLRSQHVLVLTPLDARTSFARIGGQRMVVTETRARVEEVIRNETRESEIFVRTLGGIVDGVGQLVHGQAELHVERPAVAFLTRARDSSLWITGMAQGHYPLSQPGNSQRFLTASPNLPTLVDFERSSVRALTGRELGVARRLIIEAAAR